MNLKLKENSLTVLLKVYDNDEDFTRCDYAIVKITKDLLETISKLRKGRDEMKCYEVTAFDCSCHFLAQDEFEDEQITDELVDALEDFTKDSAGVWQVEDVDMDAVEVLRTDADTVHISDFGIKFSSYGKYSGVKFDTEKISWERIDKMIL